MTVVYGHYLVPCKRHHAGEKCPLNSGNIKLENSMKSTIIALLALAFASVTIAQEMSVEDKIESAMSRRTRPEYRNNATIVDRDNTVLREGTNKWTCKTGGLPGSETYPWCHDPVFMKWTDTVWKGEPFSTDVVGYSYMLAGGFAADVFDPTRSKRRIWEKIGIYEGPHMMLIMPTHSLLENQSGDPEDDDIFVLFKSTPFEIVIIPLGDVITE